MESLVSANSYLELGAGFYHLVRPTPLKDPCLVSFNADTGEEVGIGTEKGLTALLNGEAFLAKLKTYAMCYAGHQFGYYMPRLGDGRAINLGSVNGHHLQLKGAGKTRYSREGDGRAVLRSSIREYLASEAMYGFGIPTTRAVGIIGSGEEVMRERVETAAIVLRTSPSWIRFGSFEYFYYKRKYKELEALAAYTIEESFPHLHDNPNRYLKMFEEVVTATAKLIAKWQAVGFTHGVMNTDNMSIASLTIDYGPFAFLDDYDSQHICNHTDVEGRYSFGNQPFIAEWNLSKLMQALTPLAESDAMGKILFGYRKVYQKRYIALMREKLGLFDEAENDESLILSLLQVLQDQPMDYTYFFRTLSAYHGDKAPMLKQTIMKKPLQAWLEAYDKRIAQESCSAEERCAKMKKTNPKFVLKNYMLQEAIERATEGDFKRVNDLLKIAHTPFDEHMAYDHYAKPTPPQHKNLALSCSS